MVKTLNIQSILDKYGINEELLEALSEAEIDGLFFDDYDVVVNISVSDCYIYLADINTYQILAKQPFNCKKIPQCRLGIFEGEDIILDLNLDTNLLYFLHKSKVNRASVIAKNYQYDFDVIRNPEETTILAYVNWTEGQKSFLEMVEIWIKDDTIIEVYN